MSIFMPTPPPFHMAERVAKSANGTTYMYRTQFPIITPEDKGKDPDEAGWTQERFVEAGYRAVLTRDEHGIQWLNVFVP